MGTNYHGYTTYRCFDDCRMDGCPGHRIRLCSKHGSYFVEYLNEENQLLGGNGDRTHVGSIEFIDAVADILTKERD